MKLTTGTVLGGRYTLGERIASGGMGEVWEAVDGVLGRTVAIKMLRASVAEDEGFADRFRAEARNSASLSHPNIAAVHDYGEDEDSAYLVMENVPGQPLSRIIAERSPLSAEETAALVGQAAAALEAAHRAGFVHRDVKPANILVTPDGTVKLTDFGIARALDGISMTRTGEVLGTPQYLSPEQALGKPATPASDLYSLGIVAHEMLSGKRPFDAETPVVVALAQVNDPPPELPEDVPAPLRDVVMSSLAKDPAERPQSAATVAELLGVPVSGPIPLPTLAEAQVGQDGQDATTDATVASPGRTADAAALAAGVGAIGGAVAGSAAAAAAASGVAPAGSAGAATVRTPVGQGPHTPVAPLIAPLRSPLRFLRGRRGPVWVGAALAVLLIAGLSLNRCDGGASAAKPPQRPSSRPVPTLSAQAYLGQPVSAVAKSLTSLGYKVLTSTRESTHAPGTVIAISPVGPVPTGSTILVVAAAAPKASSTPAASATAATTASGSTSGAGVVSGSSTTPRKPHGKKKG